MPLDEAERRQALSPHFLVGEAFSPKCDVNNLAVPYDQARQNAQFLASEVLEPVRAALNSPLGINSWARDLTFNASLAKDPASAARVQKRPGPHCDGSAADIRITKADKLDMLSRNASYYGAFVTIYQLAVGPSKLPINEAILEYAKDNIRITHIHLQARVVGAKRRFVLRKWKDDAEIYLTWKP